jgi:lipopolysaccharide transport system ATP-binding protein
MSEPIIQVEQLGKKYHLGQQKRERYTALRDVIAHSAKNLFQAIQNPQQKRRSSGEFWALKDVSFEIQQGDRVGIIGRNGAGKSTLLKILSRITAPTQGSIRLRGRVASLLEVGTGFHPELTGRENIYLNGAILGMSKAEIRHKFDEIVDFAEIEKFLDTPVKRYSSGMYVRLAFAVAAHLEPEILVIDEVLAVGDAQFQQKCLGKMQTVASEGRTVIFVSHQMAAISNLCSSCIVLQNGELCFQGQTPDAIERYLGLGIGSSTPSTRLQDLRPAWAKPYINAVRLLDAQGQERTTLPLGSSLTLEMSFSDQGLTRLKTPMMGVVINHATSGVIGGVNTWMTRFEPDGDQYASAIFTCTLEHPPLLQGNYSIDLWLGDGDVDVDTLTGCLRFHLEETDIYETGRTPFGHLGVMFLEPKWSISPQSKRETVTEINQCNY